MIYRQTLDELSDDAWMGAVWSALKTAHHFPVPAELHELALDYAEAASTERIRLAAVARNQEIAATTQKMLVEGRITDEQAAENKHRYDRMVSDTLKQLRVANASPRRAGDGVWRHEDRAYGNQRIADGHWEKAQDEE